VPAAAEDAGDRRRVDLRRPAARDGEDAVVHLHEHHERPSVRQVDDLVGEVRDAVDMTRPRHRRNEDLDARDPFRLARLQEGGEQLTLVVSERRVEKSGEQILAGAVP
jgi:hypothetical protein